MKCPYCDKEMEQGEIRSQRTMYFISDSADSFYTASKEEKIKISSNNWTAPKVRAYACKDCKKIILDFRE